MIIDQTEVVEALLARDLIPMADQHHLNRAPEPREVVWYELSDGVATLYTSGIDEPWLTVGAHSHDEIERMVSRIGRVPIEIGGSVRLGDPEILRDICIPRQIFGWHPLNGDAATMTRLELDRQAYVAYEGSVWWGRTQRYLMTDPMYVWLIDREIKSIRGGL